MVAYKQDKEYMHYVGHLIATPKVQKLGKIPHLLLLHALGTFHQCLLYKL